MPWNADYFPASMKHLPAVVREKAIDIANALLDERMDEGRRSASPSRARRTWGRHHCPDMPRARMADHARSSLDVAIRVGGVFLPGER